MSEPIQEEKGLYTSMREEMSLWFAFRASRRFTDKSGISFCSKTGKRKSEIYSTWRMSDANCTSLLSVDVLKLQWN